MWSDRVQVGRVGLVMRVQFARGRAADEAHKSAGLFQGCGRRRSQKARAYVARQPKAYRGAWRVKVLAF